MSRTNAPELEVAAKEISRLFVEAWCYLDLLKGISDGARSNPAVLDRFRWLFSELYRGVFDALFVKVGVLVDRHSKTHSIPSFAKRVKLIPDMVSDARAVEAHIYATGGDLEKLRNWRHRMVAHRVVSGDDHAFFEENKMNLGDLESSLESLEEQFNKLTVGAISVHHDNRSGTDPLSEQVALLFAAVTQKSEPERDA